MGSQIKVRKGVIMRTGTYYLNNLGSRWVTLPKEKVLVFHGAEGYCKMRTIEFYSSFGNFGVCHLRYKGKMIHKFMDEVNGVRIIFIDHTEKYAKI
jgi:hypothetical protein